MCRLQPALLPQRNDRQARPQGSGTGRAARAAGDRPPLSAGRLGGGCGLERQRQGLARDPRTERSRRGRHHARGTGAPAHHPAQGGQPRSPADQRAQGRPLASALRRLCDHVGDLPRVRPRADGLLRRRAKARGALRSARAIPSSRSARRDRDGLPEPLQRRCAPRHPGCGYRLHAVQSTGARGRRSRRPGRAFPALGGNASRKRRFGRSLQLSQTQRLHPRKCRHAGLFAYGPGTAVAHRAGASRQADQGLINRFGQPGLVADPVFATCRSVASGT